MAGIEVRNARYIAVLCRLYGYIGHVLLATKLVHSGFSTSETTVIFLGSALANQEATWDCTLLGEAHFTKRTHIYMILVCFNEN
jgi:hypothetical protein